MAAPKRFGAGSPAGKAAGGKETRDQLVPEFVEIRTVPALPTATRVRIELVPGWTATEFRPGVLPGSVTLTKIPDKVSRAITPRPPARPARRTDEFTKAAELQSRPESAT